MSRPSPPRPVKRSVRLDLDEDDAVQTLATRLSVEWAEAMRIMIRFANSAMSTADAEVGLVEERRRKTRENVRTNESPAA